MGKTHAANASNNNVLRRILLILVQTNHALRPVSDGYRGRIYRVPNRAPDARAPVAQHVRAVAEWSLVRVRTRVRVRAG